MKKPQLFAGLLASVVLLCGLTVQASAAEPQQTEPHTHYKYLDSAPDGRFWPAQPLTRAQAARIVYDLLEQPPLSMHTFPDVPLDTDYEQAAAVLVDSGMLSVDAGGAFRPDAPLTRGECAQLLSGFLPEPEVLYSFRDVSGPELGAVSATVAGGLLSADETGAFRPDEPLTRAEAAVVFNRLMGRSPNPSAIAAAAWMRVFPDVPVNHWAYEQIIEATTTHDALLLEGNPYEIWSSFVAEYPRVVESAPPAAPNMTVSNAVAPSTAAPSTAAPYTAEPALTVTGYTSGNSVLDAKLAEIVAAQTNDGMSRDEKLRALYNYVTHNFTYIKRDLIKKGQTGWEPSYAASFFADGRGNCFSFAAAFQQLARAVGVDAKTVVGNLGKNRQVHGWVEIELDGTTYVFDPELETVYRGRGKSYNLFKFQYSTAPFSYWK